MSSLITIVRNKFLDAIREVNPPSRWKILVVDEHSQRLLNSVLKQFDILEENVTLIESITTNREPQPGFEAVYMVMPTTANVDRIIRDFSNGRQQYAAAHLFFIEGLSEQLFEKLTSSAAEPFLKGLRELFVNFWAIESQAYSLKLPEQFFSMFSPPRGDSSARAARDRLEEDLRFVSRSIANVCITLNEFPYIRYYTPSHHLPLGPLKPHETTRAAPAPPEGSARWRTNLARGDQARAYEAADSEFLSKLLAFMVQSALEEHKKANPDFPKQDAGRARSTLIITDRAMDVMAPLTHEFTYQAMANDLLPIEDGSKYTYKFQSSVGAFEDKTATLSDSDTVWTDVRHMHMREAIDKLMADFNKFMTDNAGFKGEGAATLNDMKDMLASLPQYQEQREKFSLHLNMAQECMDIFARDKLPVVATVEQNCATGLTVEGKTPKTLVEEMVPLLDSREVINSNKVRIIALYIQFREGVPDEDRRRLYQHARLSLPEQDAVNGLVHLGVRISRGPGDKDLKKRIKQKPTADEEYELSRFKPLLRTVIEDVVAGRLEQSVFPYVKDYPSASPAVASQRPTPTPTTSLRSAKPSWHRAARPGGTTSETRQRVLIFVAGGMTYSEMREAYHLSNSLNKDIYIGSTHTFTPRQFVDDLKVLELGGIGSRALPNGLKEGRGGKRPYQDYYDEKYFTRDAPAPTPVRPQAVRKSASSRPAPRAPSPERTGTSSTLSVNSVGIPGRDGKDKKEKKHRFGLKW
ncbi:Sec1-like snare protein [Artomyces pyxidatus]|uniref:Sec1-like snare protein n=1 Tax=Artomyces pyxidatus TaxID=48021 RepID=A0ACB8SXW9_9AGAM|nr:Sec1-like snare protein [Artomyces pyxidatus]